MWIHVDLIEENNQYWTFLTKGYSSYVYAISEKEIIDKYREQYQIRERCPNPFVEEFIKENGTPYDEKTDDYHREPFAVDVSEGKNDVVYSTHNYHTKVPHKAIMRYILHYTNPDDVVLDGFFGSGMTGVAAQMCCFYVAKHPREVGAELREKIRTAFEMCD